MHSVSHSFGLCPHILSLAAPNFASAKQLLACIGVLCCAIAASAASHASRFVEAGVVNKVGKTMLADVPAKPLNEDVCGHICRHCLADFSENLSQDPQLHKSGNGSEKSSARRLTAYSTLTTMLVGPTVGPAGMLVKVL